MPPRRVPAAAAAAPPASGSGELLSESALRLLTVAQLKGRLAALGVPFRAHDSKWALISALSRALAQQAEEGMEAAAAEDTAPAAAGRPSRSRRRARSPSPAAAVAAAAPAAAVIASRPSRRRRTSTATSTAAAAAASSAPAAGAAAPSRGRGRGRSTLWRGSRPPPRIVGSMVVGRGRINRGGGSAGGGVTFREQHFSSESDDDEDYDDYSPMEEARMLDGEEYAFSDAEEEAEYEYMLSAAAAAATALPPPRRAAAAAPAAAAGSPSRAARVASLPTSGSVSHPFEQMAQQMAASYGFGPEAARNHYLHHLHHHTHAHSHALPPHPHFWGGEPDSDMSDDDGMGAHYRAGLDFRRDPPLPPKPAPFSGPLPATFSMTQAVTRMQRLAETVNSVDLTDANGNGNGSSGDAAANKTTDNTASKPAGPPSTPTAPKNQARLSMALSPSLRHYAALPSSTARNLVQSALSRVGIHVVEDLTEDTAADSTSAIAPAAASASAAVVAPEPAAPSAAPPAAAASAFPSLISAPAGAPLAPSSRRPRMSLGPAQRVPLGSAAAEEETAPMVDSAAAAGADAAPASRWNQIDRAVQLNAGNGTPVAVAADRAQSTYPSQSPLLSRSLPLPSTAVTTPAQQSPEAAMVFPVHDDAACPNGANCPNARPRTAASIGAAAPSSSGVAVATAATTASSSARNVLAQMEAWMAQLQPSSNNGGSSSSGTVSNGLKQNMGVQQSLRALLGVFARPDTLGVSFFTDAALAELEAFVAEPPQQTASSAPIEATTAAADVVLPTEGAASLTRADSEGDATMSDAAPLAPATPAAAVAPTSAAAGAAAAASSGPFRFRSCPLDLVLLRRTLSKLSSTSDLKCLCDAVLPSLLRKFFAWCWLYVNDQAEAERFLRTRGSAPSLPSLRLLDTSNGSKSGSMEGLAPLGPRDNARGGGGLAGRKRPREEAEATLYRDDDAATDFDSAEEALEAYANAMGVAPEAVRPRTARGDRRVLVSGGGGAAGASSAASGASAARSRPVDIDLSLNSDSEAEAEVGSTHVGLTRGAPRSSRRSGTSVSGAGGLHHYQDLDLDPNVTSLFSSSIAAAMSSAEAAHSSLRSAYASRGSSSRQRDLMSRLQAQLGAMTRDIRTLEERRATFEQHVAVVGRGSASAAAIVADAANVAAAVQEQLEQQQAMTAQLEQQQAMAARDRMSPDAVQMDEGVLPSNEEQGNADQEEGAAAAAAAASPVPPSSHSSSMVHTDETSIPYGIEFVLRRSREIHPTAGATAGAGVDMPDLAVRVAQAQPQVFNSWDGSGTMHSSAWYTAVLRYVHPGPEMDAFQARMAEAKPPLKLRVENNNTKRLSLVSLNEDADVKVEPGTAAAAAVATPAPAAPASTAAAPAPPPQVPSAAACRALPLSTLVVNSFLVLLCMPQMLDTTSSLSRDLWVVLAALPPVVHDEFAQAVASLPAGVMRGELQRWVEAAQAFLSIRVLSRRVNDQMVRGAVRSLALFHRINQLVAERSTEATALSPQAASAGHNNAAAAGSRSGSHGASPALDRSVFLNDTVTAQENMLSDFNRLQTCVERQKARVALEQADRDAVAALQAEVDARASGRAASSIRGGAKRVRFTLDDEEKAVGEVLPSPSPAAAAAATSSASSAAAPAAAAAASLPASSSAASSARPGTSSGARALTPADVSGAAGTAAANAVNPNVLSVESPADFCFTQHAFLFDASALSRIVIGDSQRTQQDLLRHERDEEAAQRMAAHNSRRRGRRGGGNSSAAAMRARLAAYSSGLGSPNAGVLMLNVRRPHILEDTLAGIAKLPHPSRDLKRPLKISFQGEEGIDAGGVKREYFTLLFQTLMSPAYNMWSHENEFSVINPTSLCSLDDAGRCRAPSTEAELGAEARTTLAEYELTGTLLGLAVYNSVQLSLVLPKWFWKKLQHASHAADSDVDAEGSGAAAAASASSSSSSVPPLTYSLDDLSETHPEIAKGLHLMLRHPASSSPGEFEATFGLEWTVEQSVFGALVSRELEPGSAGRPVTLENREAYVKAYVHFMLHDSIALQFGALARGFYKVCARAPFRLLAHPADLELLVCGNQTPDFDQLELAASYDGWHQHPMAPASFLPARSDGTVRPSGPLVPQAPVISHFWSWFHGLSIQLKRRLLAFVSGSDRIPIKGLRHATFTIVNGGQDQRNLPSSHTCFGQLVLPNYSSVEILHEKMMMALQEGHEGFALR